MRTREVMTISLSASLLKEIEERAEKEGRNKSQMVRDALIKYLADKRWQEYRQQLTLKARALGFYTEEDVENMVDDIRDENND
ncbi:ribbon-helix-helix protein, CopG family [bacterium]|nr:ribbon-helix-helix protein, CopG family [bacterium]